LAGQKAKRIVIKLGTTLLTKGAGSLNRDYIRRLAGELVELKEKGKELVLVSSGAIRAGEEKLKFIKRLKTVPEKQAAASIGQGLLMEVYTRFFAARGQTVGQVLLTREDVAERKRYLNAKNTFLTLFKYGAIPIVNENDTVAVEEIQFGDNDTLSALTASLIEADLLIILSDVEGLYTADPQKKKDIKLISEVKKITPDLEKLAGEASTSASTGGMYTKLQAAKIATSSGITMVIADGRKRRVVTSIVEGKKIGTLFLPRKKKLGSRKCWIAFSLPAQGELKVNEGARKMLENFGKSLLPIGITKIKGNFKRGEMVSILDEKNKEFARGLVNYSGEEVGKILGKKTKEVFKILGYKYEDEVIHADNLAIIE